MPWDEQVDFLVVGSGAGGLTAALTAHAEGMRVLVVEKSATYGGSSARSGGGVWIPNNLHLKAEGTPDSWEQAVAYMRHTVGDRVPWPRQEMFLRVGPVALAWLEANTEVRFQRMKGYPDYYPERPGGLVLGRVLEPVPFDGRLLGPELERLHPPPFPTRGMPLTGREYRDLVHLRRTWRGRRVALQVALRALWSWARGRRLLTMGQALIGRLRYSMLRWNIPLWLESPLEDLILDRGRVVGAVVRRQGRAVRIQTRRGVLLAAGGFPHNALMRRRYLPHPTDPRWSVANPANTGDAILLAMSYGAAVDLMDQAWWGPVSLPPDLPAAFFHVSERAMPGSLMVNARGQRFVNEAAPYLAVVQTMYRLHSPQNPHIPAFFIFDDAFRQRYFFGPLLPGQPLPRQYLETGYIVRASTLEELARGLGIDPRGLVRTVERFNHMARQGRDEDFHRGESAYDRYYSDPRVHPNPNLAPLERPPFYGVRLYPGDIGTKGGLVTDEHARVLREDGAPIPGLYATGNTAASVMGETSPGAGSTLGPALVFGYIAALHAARRGPDEGTQSGS